jgi:hypothetical protein
MQAALWAEHAAAKALIETAPTTRAGLRTLESYLREDRAKAMPPIRHTKPVGDTGWVFCTGDFDCAGT